jgi:hypothetical protein
MSGYPPIQTMSGYQPIKCPDVTIPAQAYDGLATSLLACGRRRCARRRCAIPASCATSVPPPAVTSFLRLGIEPLTEKQGPPFLGSSP